MHDDWPVVKTYKQQREVQNDLMRYLITYQFLNFLQGLWNERTDGTTKECRQKCCYGYRNNI